MLAVSLLLAAFLCGVDAKHRGRCKGQCSYDSPKAGVSANLQVSGASHAVSDITTEGGWTILDCDSKALAQEIRLVCQNSDCEHLFEGHGAIDTLVRLPESCGANAFARVADIKVDLDQSLPKEVAATINPTGNITSTVFLLSVDTNFAAVDIKKTGPVAFSLEGYNFAVANLTAPSLTKRGLKTRNWTAFNGSNSFDFPPLNIDQTFPLLSASVNCDHFTASVAATFETKVDATVSIGLIAAGTIIPPAITELAVYGGVQGDIIGTLDLKSSAEGSISIPRTALYKNTLAGIDFPGLFTLGPTFGVYGELEANLDADFDLRVDLAYNLNAKAYFPPDSQPSTGASKPIDSKLTLSASPNLAVRSSVVPKITPELKLGLEAFSVISASVTLGAEGSLSATLSVDGSANAGTGTEGSSASGQISACVDIGAGVDVNLAAEGSISLFGLSESAAKTYPIYSHEWDLYNKCASAQGQTKREPAAVAVVKEKRAGITCPTSSEFTSIQKIIDQIISIFTSK
ncbi:USP domain-containing protein [Favolaschia claudopus]|uniref:USP domain-containing protein n=1 Tax=Favolaschia claudopus TaxID=2862362 RepID=A0AAW0DLZ3_9AGAR